MKTDKKNKRQSAKQGLILITRPQPQAKFLSEELKNKGFETIIYPLFTIENIDEPEIKNIDLNNLQAVLITSVHAIYGLIKLDIAKNTLILAVGKNTHDKIKSAGYNRVFYADDSADSLKELALDRLLPDKGMIVYLASELVTVDLAIKLKKHGFNAHRVNVYCIKEAKKLSDDVISKISNCSIKQVVIYSQNTALILYKLAVQHNLLEYFNQIKLLCLSSKIAAYCKKLGFKKTAIFNQ